MSGGDVTARERGYGVDDLDARAYEEWESLGLMSFHGAPWDADVMLADLSRDDVAQLRELVNELASSRRTLLLAASPPQDKPSGDVTAREARLEEIVAEHEQMHRPAGKLTLSRESCEVCWLIDEWKASDPDYHPSYQDEYQRLWHDARAELEAAEARAAEMEADRDAHVDRADEAERRAAFAEARTARLTEALTLAIEIIEDAWNQWAYTNGKGERITGGLSTLEWIEAELPNLRAALSLSDGKGDA